MEEVLKNPIVRNLLVGKFKSFLKEKQIHGIYLFLDENGEIAIANFKNKPQDNEPSTGTI